MTVGPAWRWVVSAVVAAVIGVPGCVSRSLTIAKDEYINTAVHQHRAASEQTGEELEITIVCVYDKDTEKDRNELLKPGSRITCKDWYERRPGSRGDVTSFDLPASQIFLLTGAAGSGRSANAKGKVLGSAIVGAKIDGKKELIVKGITVKSGKLHSSGTAIYVFPKFLDADGHVLPVEPLVFNPPGAYRKSLACKIGVNAGGPHHGQYIQNNTNRQLHGREER